MTETAADWAQASLPVGGGGLSGGCISDRFIQNSASRAVALRFTVGRQSVT